MPVRLSDFTTGRCVVRPLNDDNSVTPCSEYKGTNADGVLVIKRVSFSWRVLVDEPSLLPGLVRKDPQWQVIQSPNGTREFVQCVEETSLVGDKLLNKCKAPYPVSTLVYITDSTNKLGLKK